MHHTSIIIHLGGFMASLAAELPPRHLVYTNQIRWKWCGFCGTGWLASPRLTKKTPWCLDHPKGTKRTPSQHTSPTKKKTAQPFGAKITTLLYTQKKWKKHKKNVSTLFRKKNHTNFGLTKNVPFPESWKCHEIGRTCEHEASRQVTTLAMFKEGWHRRCVDMILTIDIVLYMNIHNVDIQLYIAKRYIWW